MTTGPVPPLLTALVDDAGLFPPTRLAMGDALARHRADRAAGSPMLTHRFLCPASRVAELLRELGTGHSIEVGVIADTGPGGIPGVLDAMASDGRAAVRSVDVAVGSADDLAAGLAAVRALPQGVDGWVEPARRGDWLAVLPQVRAAGSAVGAKLRCGGADAAAFPTADEVASFVLRCVEHGVRFKATAGLHRAVRGLDAGDGYVHHGYLNLLIGTARAIGGEPEKAVLAAIASTDAQALVAEAKGIPDDAVAATRAAMVSYGSCSTAEPLAEASALGLLG